MCNLNILYVKNKKANITPFIMSVTSHSFATNDDGEGFFCEPNTYHKSMNKINFIKYEHSLENSNVIITHQRLSTSGFEIDYNHPFVNDDFVMIHNGIINHFKGEVGSDTYGFWLKFNEEFNAITSHIAREEKIKKVISKLFEKDEGSYSILIHDRKIGQSFYFKGEGYPSIHFYSNKDYLFVTSNADNSLFLTLLNSGKFNELQILDRTIYKISPDFSCFKSVELPKTKFEYHYEKPEPKYERPISSYSGRKGYECEQCGNPIHGIINQIAGTNLCSECAGKGWRNSYENV